MAKVAITESYLEDIADAIREKTGLTNLYYPSQMAPAIMTISGSGGITPTGTISITTNGTYNVTQYASASVEVSTGSTISNQNKSVTPTKAQQQVTYDNGYTGLGIVTVNAIPANYIIPTGNKEITENGTAIDVTEFATVSVDVSGGGGITPTGNINITSAGETNVTNYATATVAPVTFVNTISPLVITNNGSVSSSGLVSIPWTINESTYPVYTGGYADEEDEITLWNSGNLEYQLSNINLPSSASSSASSGYTSKATISRSTSDQYINIGTGYNGSGAYYKISAVADGTAGTPTATKGSVSNHSISITPSVTNTTGYITGSTKTGTVVTVTASELASGNKAITQNGTDIDVVGYSTVSVDVQGGGSSVTQDQDGYIVLPSTGGGGGGSSKQETTGTVTGDGTNVLQISCAFAPQEIYIYGDLTGDVSLRGIVSFVIIKDRLLAITNDSSTSNTQENALRIKPISGYNEENSSTEPFTSYSNGVLTINTVINSTAARWTSGISYSYDLIAYGQ